MDTKIVDVAYGCRLTSSINYKLFYSFVELGEYKHNDVIYNILATRGEGLVRGTPLKTAIMKNCAILDIEFGVKGKEKKVVSVKVFSVYLHFCGQVTKKDCSILADIIVNCILKTQKVCSNEGDRKKLLDYLQDVEKTFDTASRSQLETVLSE